MTKLNDKYKPKGELEGFPLEVINRMIECQIEQGNKHSVFAFESDSCSGKSEGGFIWSGSKEGRDFWGRVIGLRDFDYFFSIYPKETESKLTELPTKWVFLKPAGKSLSKVITGLFYKITGAPIEGAGIEQVYYGSYEGRYTCRSEETLPLDIIIITQEEFIELANKKLELPKPKPANTKPDYSRLPNSWYVHKSRYVELDADVKMAIKAITHTSYDGLKGEDLIYGIRYSNAFCGSTNVLHYQEGAVELTVEEFKNLIYNNKTIKENEQSTESTINGNSIKVCRPTETISRGTVPTGTGISGRKGKTAATSGYYSYEGIKA
jgi:hypothetical protein